MIHWKGQCTTHPFADLVTSCDISHCWSHDLLWSISLLISWPAVTYLMESSLLPDSAGVDSSSAADVSGSGGEGCPGGGKITSFSFTRSCNIEWYISYTDTKKILWTMAIIFETVNHVVNHMPPPSSSRGPVTLYDTSVTLTHTQKSCHESQQLLF